MILFLTFIVFPLCIIYLFTNSITLLSERDMAKEDAKFYKNLWKSEMDYATALHKKLIEAKNKVEQIKL